MQPVAATIVALGVVLGAAGCVTEPDGDEPMGCTSPDECAPDQECREGACYDRQTSAAFAADLFAPETRTDMLPRAELEELAISGNEANVMFVRSIEVEGRIVLRVNDQLSAAAKVTFSRPSRIPGAPPYVVTTKSVAGVAPGEVAFRTRLAPTQGGETYTVTILPDDGEISPAQMGVPLPNALAPPTRLTLQAFPVRRYLPITLDAGGLRAITGQVVDAVGNGLEGMSVKAWNRRTPSEPYEVASSTAITDIYGNYVIYVPLGRGLLFDVHVAAASEQTRASLVRTGVAVTETTSLAGSTEPIRYPALPEVATYQLPVEGPTAAGGTKKIVGARVFLTTTLASGRDTITYQTEAVVGSTGFADVQLIPGVHESNRTYKAVALPPPNAEQGAYWDGSVAVGPSIGGLLPALTLAPRVQVTGRVVDAAGRPAAGLTVKPVLSAAFLTSASAATMALLERLQLPEVTTSPMGTYSMYLDGAVGTQAATYDLELVPPNGSPLPRWSRDEVAVSSGVTKVDVPEVQLPNGTLVSGTVKTEDGLDFVADAVVQVYERDGDSVRPRASAKSNAQGKISLVLPSL